MAADSLSTDISLNYNGGVIDAEKHLLDKESGMHGEVEPPTPPPLSDEDNPDGSSFIGAVANLANAAIGAGILSFAFAFKACGLILGVIVTIGFAAIMAFTLHILAEAARVSRGEQYQDIVRRMLGRKYAVVITISMIIYLVGGCIAYLNVVGDQALQLASQSDTLKDSVLGNRWFVVYAVATIIVGPLCFFHNIKLLEIPSSMGVLATVVLQVDVIVRAVQFMESNDGEGNATAVDFNLSTDVFKSVPLIAFALQCHLVLVPVFRSLKTRSVAAADRVVAVTFLVCLSLYVPTGAFGYLHFGSDTKSDILDNMNDMWDANLARVCIACTAIFSYPLLQFVARPAMYGLVSEKDIMAPEQNVKFISMTVIYLIVTAAVAAAVADLGTVLGVTGCTAGVCQIFVFPGLLYIQLQKITGKGSLLRARIVGWSLILFGIALGVVSLWVTLK